MKVLILGSGLSGKSAGEFLKKQNIEVAFATDEEINDRNLSDVHLDRLLCGLSFIVISPGISMDNLIVKKAKKKKIAVVGELELGSKCFMSNIIAVTGTNGKTTTVSLIYFLLKDCLNQVYLGGNIGIPVTSFASEFCAGEGDVAVLECSSFQLESVRKFHAHIAVVLNITEDHLNRHKTMKKYISCKQKIASNQTEKDFLLLNADSELLMQNIPKTKAKILFFSTQKKVVGCYVKHGCIYFNDGLTEKKLVAIGGIKLLGEHNLSNILAGVLCVYLHLSFQNESTSAYPTDHRQRQFSRALF
ncbi:MAG: UDP-N-acetylmuramoyl-L-alanine--D-glutamate ligase, partial [Clostridia bacterium]|nr:UDP-N-acetylmuramoyl-L-alanine--D-glutamate ligase [Clostridia bacterium]